MAATHTPTRRTRKTPNRNARRRRLPHWGWWITGLVTVIAAAKTWPLYTISVTALIAVALIVAVVRPRRLARPLSWATTVIAFVNAHRSRLPAPGHRTLADFLAMQPDQFEKAITDLAREDHTHVAHAEHTGQTADRGIDVLVTLHNGHRILVQCKHHRTGKKVGGDTVREIAGSVLASGCHAGAIITTTGYTSEAIATNVALGRNALALIDGHQLVAWANGHTPPPW